MSQDNDQTMMTTEPQEEEAVDDTPAFLNPEDAVEVAVDDDNVPMEDDDDDDDDMAQQEPIKGETTTTTTTTDMSRIQLTSHTGPVYAVASHLSPSTGRLTIVSGGGDDKGFLHHVDCVGNNNSNNTTSLRLEHSHTDSVSCAALNLNYVTNDNNTNRAAVGGYDGAIVVYDTETGQKVSQLEGPTDVEWLSFHPKGGGTVLLAGSAADGTIWMYHLPTNKCMQVFVGHESAVTAGCFSPDGRWALSASADGTLRIWAPKTGMNKHVFRLGGGGSGGSAGLTCMNVGGGVDGQLILVGSEDGQAHVCHIGTKKVVASLRHYEVPAELQMLPEDEEAELPSSVEAVGFCPTNPNWCATGGVDGVLKVWDLANQAQCRQRCVVVAAAAAADASTTTAATMGITRVQWHNALPLLFAGYTDGALRVWDARTGQLLQTYTTGSAEVMNDLNVQFLNESTAIAVTASDDGTIRLFDIPVGTLLEQAAGGGAVAS